MIINKFFNLFLIVLSTFLISSKIFTPMSANAVDFYAGYTIASDASNRFGIIARFRALDFTLSESDAIYNGVVGLATSQLTGTGYSISSTIPSQALAQGHTGESLWNLFVQNGVSMFSPAVSQILFLSMYSCDYQGASHMCIRTYVHTGNLNLSSFGIPYNTVAGLGAIVVVTPVWNSLKSLMTSGALTSLF